MQRPVLVTGGSGFIGRHLIAALRAQRTPVRVLVRRLDGTEALAAAGVELVQGDLLDVAALPALVSGVRAVFHLAGRLFVPGTPAIEYERLHVGGTLALLKACSGLDRLDCFVLCSTTGVHGPVGAVAAREDDSGHPQNAYEWTKAHAEQAATALARTIGVPLSIARPGLVYGPGDLHLLGLFRAIRGGYYRVVGRGSNHFHPVYVDDVVRGLLLTESQGARNGRSYHLVGPRPVTVRQFADAIGVAVGRPVPRTHLPASIAYAIGAAFETLPVPRRALPLTRSRVSFMIQNRAYDGSRAAQELGFAPQVDLQEGLARTVSWYRECRLL